MHPFDEVFEHYLETKIALNGRAVDAKHPDQVALKVTIPRIFESLLVQMGRKPTDFKVQGSFGNGVITAIPWVAVFNRQVTKSAQNGYYIVLLFSEDMQSCYLSLNQGITQFESVYSRRLAQEKIRESASRAQACLPPHPQSVIGPIDLAASGHLGVGYEAGAIKSFHYERRNPPSDQVLADHFAALLADYDLLIPLAKDSLQSLAPVTEAQYQHTVLDKARSKAHPKKYEEPAGVVAVPAKSNGVTGRGYVRDPSVAVAALEAADFKCEIDPSHPTFVSSAKDLPYVEAHHLVPMSLQDQYQFSLDVKANVVALCPLCHKLLHHGKVKDKKTRLLSLLDRRHQHLSEKWIQVDAQTLLSYYSKDLLEDEA